MVFAAKNLCPIQRGVLSRECPVREGPLYYVLVTCDIYDYFSGSPVSALWESLEEPEINLEEVDQLFSKSVLKKKTKQEKPVETKKTKQV